MGQQLFTDKIGTLTHSAGNITMAASMSSPAYLTIGGRQYTVTSNLVVALPTLTANQRYQVFAVVSGGSVILAISTNENSVGPAGYTSWKLVGSLYANGLGSVGFGSFINIEGIPATANPVEWTPTFSGGSGTVTNISCFWERNADMLSGKGCRFSTTGVGGITLSLPAVSVRHPDTTNYRHYGSGAITTLGAFTTSVIARGNDTAMTLALPVAGVNNGQSVYTNWAAETHTIDFSVPVVNWSNTPIKDL